MHCCLLIQRIRSYNMFDHTPKPRGHIPATCSAADTVTVALLLAVTAYARFRADTYAHDHMFGNPFERSMGVFTTYSVWPLVGH